MKHAGQITREELFELVSSQICTSQEEDEAFRRFVTECSKVFALYYKGELACVWGLRPPTLISDEAYLWFHTFKPFHEHVFAFVRHSQIEIAKMKELYPRIVGHCQVDDPKAIRWIKWLGGHFGLPGKRLIPFEIVR